MELSQPLSTAQTRETIYHPHRRRFPFSTVMVHAIIIFFCLIILLPIAWVILLSIKSIPDSVTGEFWPKHFDFSHYGYVFQHLPTVVQNFTNSIVVSLS